MIEPIEPWPEPKNWSTDPKRNIVPIDLHAPTPVKGYKMKDLYPDAEVVSSLNKLTNQFLQSEMAEEENWIRKFSIPLIDEGYRIEELVYILRSDRLWRAGRPIRALLPSKDINPLKLLIRRAWRRFIPYRLPNGQLFNKISREELPVN